MNFKSTILFASTVLVLVAGAEVMDRPVGMKIGQRLVLKPYVSLSCSYDSNVDSHKDGAEDIIWTVNPGLGVEYMAENWIVKANAYYQFNGYTKGESTNENSYHGYGEDLTFMWGDAMPGEKGWGFMISEKYMKINQVDDIMLTDGRGYNRDRQEFKVATALQRRITEKWHADVNASWYWLDYDLENDPNSYSGLYGWSRWQIGLESGYALSKWTDILISASCQGYTQENTEFANSQVASSSQGYTVQAGVGSYATERISYRALIGWSRFEYGDNADASDGLTYALSSDWKVGETWNLMFVASSYYQPCEREVAASTRVDTLSVGVAKSMVSGKLNATFDLSYRRDSREYSQLGNYDYDIDVISARIGLNYTINRYLSAFTRFEYQDSIGSGGQRSDYYDYNRFRGTLGVRFTY